MLTARLKELEAAAQALEPGPEARARLNEQVLRHVEGFLAGVRQAPANRPDPNEGRGILDLPIAETPGSLAQILLALKTHVDEPGLNPAAPGYLGYIPGGGLYFAALGDYLAAAVNRYAGAHFVSPGAVQLERMLLRWMAGLVGYPDTSAGDLTSGGSIANLIGLVTAREAMGLKAAELDRSVVYLSDRAHHSIHKALRIAGLKECPVRSIPLDSGYRMRPEALDRAIAADKQAGRWPWLVIASAGTVDTGSVDPLHAIGDIAARQRLWLHVDAAYGGFFLLCSEGKTALRGIEKSDSVVMDPHKGLFIPYGSGSVLVKDGARLVQAHQYDADYLQDQHNLSHLDEVAPGDLSPELSRHFRGLRLWLPLQIAGLAPFRAAIEEKLLLARYFRAALQEIPGFEVGPEPDLSVVTFRYIPERGDVDRFNQDLIRAVQRDGRAFLSSTILEGRFTLRLAVLSFRTHLAKIDELIAILQEKAAALVREH